MEKLDKIIARNTPPPWYMNKVVQAVIAFVAIVLAITLGVCTDLGKPAAPPKDDPGSAQPPARVDDIGIGRPSRH